MSYEIPKDGSDSTTGPEDTDIPAGFDILKDWDHSVPSGQVMPLGDMLGLLDLTGALLVMRPGGIHGLPAEVQKTITQNTLNLLNWTRASIEEGMKAPELTDAEFTFAYLVAFTGERIDERHRRLLGLGQIGREEYVDWTYSLEFSAVDLCNYFDNAYLERSLR